MSSVIEPDDDAPRLQDQLEEIQAGSPLAVVGIFLEAIRARFRYPNTDTRFAWHDDPTPLPTEDGTVVAPRTLYIESAFTVDPEARDLKPAVLVDVGDVELQTVVIGNRSAMDHRTRTERFYVQGQIPVSIVCLSDNKAESATIGHLVWMHLAAISNYLRADFSLGKISLPRLSKTQIYRRAEGGADAWTTGVSLGVTLDYHWITQPMAPLLKEIHGRLSLAGDGNETTGAIMLASRTSRTR